MKQQEPPRITIHDLAKTDWLELQKELINNKVNLMPITNEPVKKDGKQKDFKSVMEITFEITQVSASVYALWAIYWKNKGKPKGQKITIEQNGKKITIELSELEKDKVGWVGDFRDILDNLKNLLKM